MASLLDRVLSSKDNPSADSLLSPQQDLPHQLPDGATVYSSTLAAIDRILRLNPHLHKRLTGYHSKPYALYNGHTPISLADKKTLLTLLRADWLPRTNYQLVYLIDQVTEKAPLLTRSQVLIPPDLLWDADTATLTRLTDEELKQAHTVS